MEDENFEVDLETLRDFVSPSIFDVLHSSESTSDLGQNAQPTVSSPSACASAHCSVDDHTPTNLCFDSDPPPQLFPEELDAVVEALLAECSQRFEEEQGLRQQGSKRMKLDPAQENSVTLSTLTRTK